MIQRRKRLQAETGRMSEVGPISRRLSFSQRYGHEALPEPMRLGQISDDLRRELWNATRRQLEQLRSGGYFLKGAGTFVEQVLGHYLAKPEDDIPTKATTAMSAFKTVILEHPFNRVLDLLEAMLDHRTIARTLFAYKVRGLFEEHGAPYRLDDDRPFQFIPRTTQEQGNAAAEAVASLKQAGMAGASVHLRQAAEHLRHQRYAESIAASVHAVESVARLLDPAASKDLGPALNSLEKSGLLRHRALKSGILKLYGYASDEQGVRHALLDQEAADVGEDEALFMYGACACFAAYLADKSRKA